MTKEAKVYGSFVEGPGESATVTISIHFNPHDRDVEQMFTKFYSMVKPVAHGIFDEN